MPYQLYWFQKKYGSLVVSSICKEIRFFSQAESAFIRSTNRTAKVNPFGVVLWDESEQHSRSGSSSFDWSSEL